MSALPEFLQGAYQRYKEDTSTLTSWLAFTSVNAGFAVSKPGEVSTKKSKARSHANRNATRTFTVGQLLEQARYLVSRDPLVLVVPQEIATATSRAISARAKCVDWFQRKFPGAKNATLERQNRQHKYFLDVMRMIRTTLQPYVQTSGDQGASQKWKSANRFELLEVEEVEESLSDETVFERGIDALSLQPSSATRREMALSKEEPRTDPNWMFMAFCTFQDFNAIREYLAGVWADHKAGKVDLVVASVVTELAYYMMEKMERETLYPTVNGQKLNPDKVAWRFFVYCCRLRGLDCDVDDSNFMSEDWKLLATGSMFDIAMWLCLDIQYPVNLWMKPTSPLKAFVDDAGTNNPKLDPANMGTKQTCMDDAIILARVVPDLIVISHLTMSRVYILFIQDAITKYFDAATIKKVRSTESVSLLFALRVLLDIHAELGANVDRARGRMVVISKLACQSERTYQSFLRTPYVRALGREPPEAKEHRESLRGLQVFVKNPDLEKDELLTLKNNTYRSAGVDPSNYVSMPNSPFSQNPILCGVHTLRIHLQCEEIGIGSADHWWSVMPMAHLYNAIKQLCTDPPKWPAMDRLIEAHSPEFIFFGGAPTSLEDCWKKVRLAKGLSANMSLSPQAAREQGVRKVREFRWFETNAPPLFRLMKKHLFPMSKETLDDPRFGEMLLAPVQRFFAAKAKSRRGSDETIEPLDLLELVKAELQGELGRLRIDYLALNQSSISIIRELRAEFVSQWRKLGFGGHEVGKNELDSIPHCAEDTMFLAFLSDPRATADHRVLKRAGQIIENVLRRRA
ncbi:hypothetical protein FKW77_010063 [Venturia effusa]|uniref:DUF6604 domain-containing protein n=1 Tax=Venturia effusa TaxID=50376 RepID=A0A517L6A5_9PEZI|nr:hypothetical protein FKW77_010063 [Venturia effusa]